MANNERITQISQSATDALSLVQAANDLYEKNKKYEAHVLARSNKVLYAILSDVLALYQAAKNANCLADTTKEMKAVLKERGVRTQSNSPALTVFVRFIFNSDRKKAYNYANTLAAAIAAKVTPTDLPHFIERNGGVEECKKEYTQAAEVSQKHQQHVTMFYDVVDSLKAKKAMEIVDLGGQSVDLKDGTNFAFLVARRNLDGTFEILQAIPTTTKALETAAMNELTKFALIEKEKSDVATKKADLEKTTLVAVASMSSKDSISEAA